MRKLFTFLVALVAGIGLCWADESGDCGENLTYVFNSSTGELTISGTGTKMDRIEWEWMEWKKQVTSVSLPENLTIIDGSQAFADFKISSITLPEGLTSLGESLVFHRCTSLTSIVLPAGISTIPQSTFLKCTSLATVTLPAALTSIGYGAFMSCYALNTIYCYAENPPTLGNDVFLDDNTWQPMDLSNVTLYVPYGSIAAYQAANGWKDFGTIAAIPGTTTVTWNSSDFTEEGNYTTHKGIEVNPGVDVIDFGLGVPNVSISPYGTGSFSTTNSNWVFTKIEVSGGEYDEPSFEGEGWSDSEGKRVWEGQAATVPFNLGFIYTGDECNVPWTIVFTLAPATPEPEPQGQTISGGQDPQNTTYYYSTFFDSQVKYELPAGVEAYVATISGDALTLTKIAVAGQTIPANNAVIFRATANEFTLTPSTADAVTFSATNSLQGTDIEINNVSDCYVLSDEDGVIGFYKYTGSLLHAHKAYITYTAPNNAPRRMRFIFAEEQNTTALDNAETDNMSVKVIENGQLVIIRNGVRYNAAGQVIE
ncbi:MAG: leucine-rich repeat domain-containing protein [Paludibacteraceae bacterium]|nr:leucine-rich repeat domain-containing protein [Paludibacteraceae bacterium]